MTEERRPPHIYVDADACPVKDEVYRVAGRHALRVTLVSNSWMRTPLEDRIELVVVDAQFNEADDWIVERAQAGDIVVTADIPLAARCLKRDVSVLAPDGRVFTDASIGNALAMRDLLADLREHGEMTRGPAPFTRRDRSRFLHQLDETILALQRGK